MRLNQEGIFTIILMLLICFSGIIVYAVLPDKMISNQAFKTRTEFFLTISIGTFAFIEVLSAASKLNESRKRNEIIDLNNELEKVYGPLFTLLSTYKKIVYYTDEPLMAGDRMLAVDDIFSTYPHILSEKLYSFWKEKIYNEEPQFIGSEASYWVPIKFVDVFLAEYDEKVKSYKKMLGKE